LENVPTFPADKKSICFRKRKRGGTGAVSLLQKKGIGQEKEAHPLLSRSLGGGGSAIHIVKKAAIPPLRDGKKKVRPRKKGRIAPPQGLSRHQEEIQRTLLADNESWASYSKGGVPFRGKKRTAEEGSFSPTRRGAIPLPSSWGKGGWARGRAIEMTRELYEREHPHFPSLEGGRPSLFRKKEGWGLLLAGRQRGREGRRLLYWERRAPPPFFPGGEGKEPSALSLTGRRNLILRGGCLVIGLFHDERREKIRYMSSLSITWKGGGGRGSAERE